jgi:hypothetical protein
MTFCARFNNAILQVSDNFLLILKSAIYIYIYIYIYIQGVTGGTDNTSGGCSLGQTIPI